MLCVFYGSSSAEFLPKLHTLVLTNNRLVNLVEIDPLASIPKLQYLSLLDNNITKKPNYRLYVIHKLKSLRALDFIKVKAKVRIFALSTGPSLLTLYASLKLLLLLHLKCYTELTLISSSKLDIKYDFYVLDSSEDGIFCCLEYE